MDARDAGTAWDLRCLVREKLIDFLQREYPESLPRTRAELDHLPEPEGSRAALEQMIPAGSRDRG